MAFVLPVQLVGSYTQLERKGKPFSLVIGHGYHKKNFCLCRIRKAQRLIAYSQLPPKEDPCFYEQVSVGFPNGKSSSLLIRIIDIAARFGVRDERIFQSDFSSSLLFAVSKIMSEHQYAQGVMRHCRFRLPSPQINALTEFRVVKKRVVVLQIEDSRVQFFLKEKLLQEGSAGAVFLLQELSPDGAKCVLKVAHTAKKILELHPFIKGEEKSFAKRAGRSLVNESRVLRDLWEDCYVPGIKEPYYRVVDVEKVAQGNVLSVGCLGRFYSGGDIFEKANDKAREVAEEQVKERVADCADLVLGLAHAHKLGICHCDIKGENVFCENGAAGGTQLFLGDWGGAVRCGEASKLASSFRTPESSPQEELESMKQSLSEGREGDAFEAQLKLDVFALGLTLYGYICEPVEPPLLMNKETRRPLFRMGLRLEPWFAERAGQACCRLIREMLSEDPGKRPSMAEVSERWPAKAESVTFHCEKS